MGQQASPRLGGSVLRSPWLEKPLIRYDKVYLSYLYMNGLVPRSAALSETFPAILQRAGKNAMFATDEFFSARLSNPHTRRAFARPVGRFLAWRE